MHSGEKSKGKTMDKTANIYHLRVKLAFDKRTYRDILIRGDQTFAVLHEIIFRAFDRDEEHLYRFTIKKAIPGMIALNKAFRDMGISRRRDNSYETIEISAPECDGDDYYCDRQYNAAKTMIRKFNFEPKQKFEYLFDFGDEWRHEIEVIAVLPPGPKGKYPVITNIKGASPAQYADYDEDNENY